MLFRALLVLVVSSCALAQGPPPAAPLPAPGALPGAPSVGGLPGADRRECGPTKYSALCPAGRWAQFSSMTLKAAAPRFTADYTIEQASNGELHATYRERVAGHDRGGEIILIGADGFAYRSREAFPDPGSIIDYMTSNPLMMSALAGLLLDLGVLGPPAEVAAPQQIKATSATQYLRTPAPRTAILYGAPWSMTGTVRRAADDAIAFSLRLRYTPVDRHGNAVKGRSETLALDGQVSYGTRREAFPASFDLVGWKLMKVDAPQRSVATLGEAREAIGP